MNLMTEKEAFSKRLTQLLNDSGLGISSPTHIAREFNRRYPGKPVTVQAVRKWLSGEAIPSGDKIRALSLWLKASPHWLHYGENEKSGATVLSLGQRDAAYDTISADLLLEEFQRLAPRQRSIVAEIVHALLRSGGG